MTRLQHWIAMFVGGVAVGLVLATARAADDGVIWQSGLNLYVKLASTDTDDTVSNQHPVALDPRAVGNALGRLAVTGGGDAARPLFTTGQIDLLAQHITTGLHAAGAEQDLVFVLERSVDRAFGLKSDRLFVAGRVFYARDRLNLIVGEHDRLRDQAYESVYDPTHQGILRYHLDHGARSGPSQRFAAELIEAPGVARKVAGGSARADWIEMDLRGFEPSGGPGARPAQSGRVPARDAATGHQPAMEPPPGRIEQRLMLLNRLKAKGLITDEEFQRKRQDILDEI